MPRQLRTHIGLHGLGVENDTRMTDNEGAQTFSEVVVINTDYRSFHNGGVLSKDVLDL